MRFLNQIIVSDIEKCENDSSKIIPAISALLTIVYCLTREFVHMMCLNGFEVNDMQLNTYN